MRGVGNVGVSIMSETSQNDGGIGGTLFDRAVNERSDTALVRRAIKGGWNVSDKLKALVLARMELIVENSEEERNAIAAGKVVAAADSIDQRTEASAKEPSPSTPSVVINNNVSATGIDLRNLTDDELDTLERLHSAARGIRAGEATSASGASEQQPLALHDVHEAGLPDRPPTSDSDEVSGQVGRRIDPSSNGFHAPPPREV